MPTIYGRKIDRERGWQTRYAVSAKGRHMAIDTQGHEHLARLLPEKRHHIEACVGDLGFAPKCDATCDSGKRPDDGQVVSRSSNN